MYSRIRACDVQIGDWIADARTHPFMEVIGIVDKKVQRWITLRGDNGNGIVQEFPTKPKRSKRMWRRER